MANYEIISQQPVHPSKVLSHIEQKVEEKELTYREEKILEYLKDSNKLSLEEFNTAFEELKALGIPRLEDSHLIKILEILPRNGVELRSIVSHGGVVVVDDVVTQILDIVKKYQ